jgi:5-methylcytosine-specific restriction endonuclease McrA
MAAGADRKILSRSTDLAMADTAPHNDPLSLRGIFLVPAKKNQPDAGKLDRIVAETRRNRDQRERDYRQRALKLYPWICGRCAREFTRENLHELTVHHRDHNHDNNPSDGSNWELLCLYCHDNEHARQIDASGAADTSSDSARATYQPFADLRSLMKDEK